MEEGAAPDSKPVVYRMPCAAEHVLDELTVYETKHRIFIIAKCVLSRRNPSDTLWDRHSHRETETYAQTHKSHAQIRTQTHKSHAHAHAHAHA